MLRGEDPRLRGGRRRRFRFFHFRRHEIGKVVLFLRRAQILKGGVFVAGVGERRRQNRRMRNGGDFRRRARSHHRRQRIGMRRKKRSRRRHLTRDSRAGKDGRKRKGRGGGRCCEGRCCRGRRHRRRTDGECAGRRREGDDAAAQLGRGGGKADVRSGRGEDGGGG